MTLSIKSVTSYGGGALKLVDSGCRLTRQLFQPDSAILEAAQNGAKGGKKAITVLSLPLDFGAVAGDIRKLLSMVDIEGIALSSSQTLLDLLAAIDTAVSVASYVTQIPPALAAVMTPLSINVLAGNILLNGYQTYRAREVYKEMTQENLEEKLKEPSFSRAFAKEAKAAVEALGEEEELSSEFFEKLKNLQGLCVTIGELMFLNSLVALAGLILLTTAINPAIPTALLLITTAVKIGLSLYKESLTPPSVCTQPSL